MDQFNMIFNLICVIISSHCRVLTFWRWRAHYRNSVRNSNIAPVFMWVDRTALSTACVNGLQWELKWIKGTYRPSWHDDVLSFPINMSFCSSALPLTRVSFFAPAPYLEPQKRKEQRQILRRIIESRFFRNPLVRFRTVLVGVMPQTDR